MLKRRSLAAGLVTNILWHIFHAIVITTYLLSGGTLEKAHPIASREAPRTTNLYDQTSDEVSLDEIE